ncbi:hypothetical protein [Chryseobacterium daeguense]|uniref:hypothetical protein n=1 Tax=Chryseobacterium daeguense TaxID=412438 RepID=UPI000427E437|nr:hypothetical protein [Chryseobacterium daeguense]
MEKTIAQTKTNEVAHPQEDLRIKLQNFVTNLNKHDPKDGVESTPDGRARSIGISHIEMTLDEYFLGLWETENFRWSVISNEVVGSLDLIVTHPVTGQKYKRVGAASIIIMVDKGASALDVTKKKANALDLGFPKLKAECLKNAAQSLGKLFGRDLNRGARADIFSPRIKETVN